MGTHADADGGDLADLVVACDFTGTQFGFDTFEDALGLGKVATVDGEGKVGGAIVADVLDDHVDINVASAIEPRI